MNRNNHSRKLVLFSIVVLVFVFGATTEVLAQKASITGGADQSGHNYSWTITNHDSSPIIEVTIPHFRADLFGPLPDGWDHTATEIIGKTGSGKSGICHYKVSNPVLYSVGKGKSISFFMRIAPKGAPRGKGNVIIKFQDGEELVIPGVEVSVRPSWVNRNGPMLGMGICLAFFVIFMRKKSSSAKAASK